MAYYPDLSPYLFAGDLAFPEVLCVGWLKPGHPYNEGEVAQTTSDRLATLIVHKACNRMRSRESCRFCRPHGDPLGYLYAQDWWVDMEADGKVVSLGRSEL